MNKWIELDEEIDALEEIAWGHDDADEPDKARRVRAKIAKLKAKRRAEEEDCLAWSTVAHG